MSFALLIVVLNIFAASERGLDGNGVSLSPVLGGVDRSGSFIRDDVRFAVLSMSQYDVSVQGLS